MCTVLYKWQKNEKIISTLIELLFLWLFLRFITCSHWCFNWTLNYMQVHQLNLWSYMHCMFTLHCITCTDPKPCYYTSETYRTVQCKKRTVPFMKRNVPCKKRTVPFKKRTVPFMKRTVPCKKRTVPCKKRSVPFKKRTETFMNFFELISKTTPPKKCHWLFKIQKNKTEWFRFYFINTSFYSRWYLLILFNFSFHFEILISCCHR